MIIAVCAPILDFANLLPLYVRVCTYEGKLNFATALYVLAYSNTNRPSGLPVASFQKFSDRRRSLAAARREISRYRRAENNARLTSYRGSITSRKFSRRARTVFIRAARCQGKRSAKTESFLVNPVVSSSGLEATERRIAGNKGREKEGGWVHRKLQSTWTLGSGPAQTSN